MAANKVPGIRAALCHDAYTATMARAHNNAQILAFGERVVGMGVVTSMIDAFIATEFEGGRHERRVEKIDAIETHYRCG
jgi:ribose 5-phosphate isomerase B